MKKQAEGKQKVQREGRAFKEWEAKKSDVIKKTEESFFAVMGKHEEVQADSDKSGLEEDSYVDKKEKSAGLEQQEEQNEPQQEEQQEPEHQEGGEGQIEVQDQGQGQGEGGQEEAQNEGNNEGNPDAGEGQQE